MMVAFGLASQHACGTEFVGSALDLGSSARGLGLGGAFTALVDDEAAVVHNPAALGTLESVAFSSLYVQQFGGITYGSISLAAPWMGLNVSLVDSGLIDSTQGAFRYTSYAVSVAGGVPLGPLGLGVRWRYVRVSSPGPGTGWSLDPALLIAVGGLRIGAVYESAYSAPMRYASGTDEAFAPSLRLGVSATLTPSADVVWSASFEASGLFASSVRFCAGLEAWIGGLGARVGYDGVGPTFGLTIRFSEMQLDWAYAVRSDLGESHRVSLSFRF
jgi:hypothetical protein